MTSDVNNHNKHTHSSPLVQKRYLIPFILITSLFALWGFANDITNPMVAAFQTVMEISTAKASLVQFAFYGGYATMAIPAALFIRRYSYKAGILLGLALYAIGAFMFIPAAGREEFGFFCISFYVLTFGLAFLETTANPFILSLGDRATATRRLNLAQAFNPIGSLLGMAVASHLILPNLTSDLRDDAGQIIFPTLPAMEKAAIRAHDLAVIRDPYVALGVVVLVMLAVIALVKMPGSDRRTAPQTRTPLRLSLSRLWHNRLYCSGVVAQVFYVAVQIMVWTFIIQYADRLGINKATAQKYNIAAMCLFLAGRFGGTYLMKYVRATRLLFIFALCAGACTLGAIFLDGMAGLYSLVFISLFMSIMFPSIYGVALESVRSDDAFLGAAFLVMAIVGGALMPPMQALVIDMGTVCSMPAVNASFAIPLLCFAVIAAYSFMAGRRGH